MTCDERTRARANVLFVRKTLRPNRAASVFQHDIPAAHKDQNESLYDKNFETLNHQNGEA
jgi:hypothetical protein